MNYRVVYDVTETSPEWWFLAPGVLFMAIGLLLWRFRERLPVWHGPFRTRPGLRKFFALFVLGFSTLWTAIASISVFGSHSIAVRAMQDGSVGVVEGPVENFHPMPYGGHDSERFTVKGVRFAYSDYVVSPGFNQTSSHGGPIREGLPVRIHFDRVDNAILKLEVSQ